MEPQPQVEGNKKRQFADPRGSVFAPVTSGEISARKPPVKVAYSSLFVRYPSMASQAFSASASVLKGEPPILMALLF
jgi:hypothetical protein